MSAMQLVCAPNANQVSGFFLRLHGLQDNIISRLPDSRIASITAPTVNMHPAMVFQQARQRRRLPLISALGGSTEQTFAIPAAPILIPKGPWKEVDGCVNAPKGFKSQGGSPLM